jgi:hypothetical protein
MPKTVQPSEMKLNEVRIHVLIDALSRLDYTGMPKEEAAQQAMLFHLRRRIPTPKAPTFKPDGRMRCVKCKRWNVPHLEETGYSITHDLRAIEGNTITARGWDGDSNKASEEGDKLWLMCPDCGHLHPLPDGMEVEWI